MTKETHNTIRKLMTQQGIWELVYNMKVYTVQELFDEIGLNQFTPELITLLKEHVNRVQKYLDDRILEPKIKQF